MPQVSAMTHRTHCQNDTGVAIQSNSSLKSPESCTLSELIKNQSSTLSSSFSCPHRFPSISPANFVFGHIEQSLVAKTWAMNHNGCPTHRLSKCSCLLVKQSRLYCMKRPARLQTAVFPCSVARTEKLRLGRQNLSGKIDEARLDPMIASGSVCLTGGINILNHRVIDILHRKAEEALLVDGQAPLNVHEPGARRTAVLGPPRRVSRLRRQKATLLLSPHTRTFCSNA